MNRSAIAWSVALMWGGSAFAGDFNGDGFEDLAVGVPFEDIGAQQDAGGVNVLYGQTGFASLFSVAADQFLTATGLGLGVSGEEQMGSALAVGDFNGDGFDDLAIGCPGATVSGLLAAGRVIVVQGGPSGLDTSTVSTFHQDSPGLKDAVEPKVGDPTRSDERFGWRLTVGDFDGNGYDDLAASVRESFGAGAKLKAHTGAVHVLRGSANGLTAKGNQQYHLDAKGVPGTGAAFASFGIALAAGDLDGDGAAELVVGASDKAGTLASGSVTVLRGKKKKGVGAKGARRIVELECANDVYPFSSFGASLACGDMNQDGLADLAVGARGSHVGTTSNAGAVYLMVGSPTGVHPDESLRIAPGTVALPIDPADARDVGSALAFGDFDGDGNDDLALGASLATVNGALFAGRVHVLLGSQFEGPKPAMTPTYTQGLLGMLDSADAGDQFGTSLAAGDFDGDGFVDLAISAPFEGLGSDGMGAFISLRGTDDGPAVANSQLWSQDSPSVLDAGEDDDAFGFALGS